MPDQYHSIVYTTPPFICTSSCTRLCRILTISSIYLLIPFSLHSALKLLIFIFPVKVNHPGSWAQVDILLPEQLALLHLLPHLVHAAPHLIPCAPAGSSLRFLHKLFLLLRLTHFFFVDCCSIFLSLVEVNQANI